jgi:hypothetical protein
LCIARHSSISDKKNQIISMLSFLSPVLSHDQPFHEGSAIGKDAAFYFMSGA